MRKKKLLFMLAAFDKGGIEKVTLDIVNHLDPEQYDITIYTEWYGGHCQSLVKPYVHVKPFFFRRHVKGINRLMSLLPASLLYRLFIRGKYDVEIAAGDGQCSKVISGSPNRKSKKIAWIHMDVMERGSKMKVFQDRPRAREIYQKFDKIVCVSQVCRDKFMQKFGEFPDIGVVYNPIPKEEIMQRATEPVEDMIVSPDMLTMVAVGRLVEQKGFDRLIRCCDRLIHKDHLKFNLTILGGGILHDPLKEQITQRHLESYVHLLGFRENPYKYIKRADIFVLSSRDEAFPLVVGEAVILHKIVVATDCAGISEWLGDSEYGLMVPNSEDGLYLGMKRILTDCTLREKYSKNVCLRERQISFEKALEEFAALL